MTSNMGPFLLDSCHSEIVYEKAELGFDVTAVAQFYKLLTMCLVTFPLFYGTLQLSVTKAEPIFRCVKSHGTVISTQQMTSISYDMPNEKSDFSRNT